MSFRGEQIQAFTADQVCALTGITRRQLSYWDKTDFFNPRFTNDSVHVPYRKIYSFRDLVGLRTISRLRNDDNVPLQELRKVGYYLKRNYSTPWSSVKFIVAENRKVYFQEPGGKHAFEAKEHGQSDYLVVKLADIAREVDARIVEYKRPHGEIAKNRYVVRNDPTIKGTRIRTEAIWNFHDKGYSINKIQNEFPGLNKKDVRAAINFENQQRKDAA